ncbi:MULTISPECIES: hypothetical protein [Klebsiella]|uniref:hypothetical protein n=1 Tax=Klebsiella TaxID=570 RepID=UPI0006666505|nr:MULTISPECIES: hypothetical protein [Klebsiella]KAB7549230.1 hypothetical protein GBN87_08860 [Klebsiella pneumoniae]MDU2810839.1 hypothetical protein [Klebsiella michiganensis]MDU4798485.1 hypothetical protein [Klebsiella michiganensis]VAP84902.1 Uncharacterised protein [Klebsiella pneumoniae]HBR5334027.1 hypothetical protein [Klebsiella pneumoniae]
MAALTEVKVHLTKTFSRYIKGADIIYPFDIKSIKDVIPDCIIQWWVEPENPASLSRNMAGPLMRVVGAPSIDGWSVALNETNYIDSNINISEFNGSDLTIIGITSSPGGKFNICGRLQVNAPQRSRALLYDDVSNVAVRWLNASGAALRAGQAIATSGADMHAARFVTNNGAGMISAKLTRPATKTTTETTGGASAYAMPSSNMLIGASADGATAVTGKVYAVFAFKRALTDSELSLIYTICKNFYILNGGASL